MQRLQILLLCACSSQLVWAEDTEDVQDMSDPLAVYTQVGMGVTDKGLNLKVGRSYDTGNPSTAAMNIFEVKGFLGKEIGWNDGRDNSIDSFRFRNFHANYKNGRGRQIDVQYDVKNEVGNASYSFIQAIPKIGPVSLFPLLGAGLSFRNAVNDTGEHVGGYEVPGTFAVIGSYGQVSFTDKLWFNYNPMWFTTLSGSDEYTREGIEGGSSLLAHEVALSYQASPRLSVRFFSNWSQNTDFKDGSHRLEFNYQI
ncbi:hypothetical protein JCM19235_5339 [Vibrio maritimus]|uniref:Outer membrane protein n=1 Tax=Vibrio maritimus TaxID=990268 RepID=A0A090RMW8_9VIBR|nr:hypothetical protein JCM19235_5339 [Vibrio maritimus]